MKRLLLFSLVGFLAQLIDGALGMGYGATSASLLLAFGVVPAMASASIHIAEIATTAASGISHLRFGNVDRAIASRLLLPGAIGAFAGAAALSHIAGAVIKPYISAFLLLMGVYIFIRYAGRSFKTQPTGTISSFYLTSLGFVAGFFDAIGGGGWGPITTPMLLSKNSTTPQKVIGSVDTSEFVIAVSASAGFLLFLGWESINWLLVSAFVIGGVIAAPLAAWFVKIMPSSVMGVLVGGIIILTNGITLLYSANVLPPMLNLLVIAVFLAVWLGAILHRSINRR